MPLNVRQRNLNTKNATKRNSSFNKGKKAKNGKNGDYIVTNVPSELCTIAYVGGLMALILLIVVRLMSSNWAIISDCDETYNYWEPLHYLVYGNGLQTWEYSPNFALRSYASLWFFAIPAKLFSYFGNSISVFYRLRILQALIMAGVELLFYKSICREFGVNIGRIWLFLNLPAAGCFLSSTSMLPSSWSYILTTLALAGWWKQNMGIAVFATAANVLLSWPFTALLGLPIALDYLFVRPKVMKFLSFCFIALVVILVPMIAIDSSYYGRLVIAPWNIVKYNVFSENGPDLYGVEDWYYYFMNGLLNFNIVWILCLVCPVLLFFFSILISHAGRRPSFSAPYWLSLMPLYLWLAVFWSQPHKEERFLYPVYNLILLAAAVSVDCIQKFSYAIWREVNDTWRRSGHYLYHTKPIMMMFLFIAATGGITRIYAVCKNYSSPMYVLHKLPPNPTELSYVCFGKDWYRSPSSFHLPHPNYRIRFISSKFSGQMPAPYTEDRSIGTSIVHPYFNDKNKGVNTTYLYPNQCHYLIDTNLGKPNAQEPDYSTQKDDWQILSVTPLIDAANSHRILRAFDIPFLSKKHNRYANLYLLRNRHLTAPASAV